MNTADTIVAVSSAVGPAARMIVRTSGPAALDLLQRLSPVAGVSPSTVLQATLSFAELVVPASVYIFLGPRSYTGDDLVEYHVPGNPLLARLLVDALIAAGARPAEAGEFTARAFLNGRMDLAAAEGVALAIAATHAGELRAARQLLAGELSRRLAGPLETLVDALALVESNLDFAEEDIAFIDAAEVRRRVDSVAEALRAIADDGGAVERLAGEPTFVLVGLPNAGKSTLLNALAGVDRAVVSPVAGTTRDALSAEVTLPRGLVRMIDVAGLERAGGDEIGRKTQDHARRAIEQADYVVEVRDGTSAERAWLPRAADAIVITKSDLTENPSGCHGLVLQTVVGHRDEVDPAAFERLPRFGVPNRGTRNHIDPATPTVTCSAVTGEGLSALKHALDGLAFGGASAPATLALTARHVAALDTAVAALATIADDPDAASEILADSLRRAVDALGGILGRVSPDDVLGRVFATFCVGK